MPVGRKAFSRLPRIGIATCNALMNSKVQVRQRVQAALRFSAETLAEKSALLCAALLLNPAWIKAHTVAVFAPHTGEPDIERLGQDASFKTFCYPRVRDDELDFFRVIAGN